MGDLAFRKSIKILMLFLCTYEDCAI